MGTIVKIVTACRQFGFGINKAHLEMSLLSRLRPICSSKPLWCSLMRQQQRTCSGGFKIDCGRVNVKINVVKGIDYNAVPLSKYDAHNADLGRPLSPHMGIYKPQLTWVLSLAHRITGIVMAFYMYTFAAGIWLVDNLEALLAMISDLYDTVGETLWHAGKYSLRFLIAFPFVFHCGNALRHLVWDSGRLLRIKQVYGSGWLMQALVLAITLPLVFQT